MLNAVQMNNATAGGGAYINNVAGLTLSYNTWSNNTASIGSGAIDLQTVKNAQIANDTFTGCAFLSLRLTAVLLKINIICQLQNLYI